jgi:hypothetical protein
VKKLVSNKIIGVPPSIKVLIAITGIVILASLWLRLVPAHHDNKHSFDTNSLALTSITRAEEPSILTYSIPLSIDVSSNRWFLKLMDNGKLAKGYDFIRQTNSTYLVEWNTTFASPGIHVLRVGLERRFQEAVFGPQRIENVTNLVQFDPGGTSFGGRACFSGILRVSSANYKIDIYDTNNILLKTITNHTDKGAFDEIWDLKTEDGQVREDASFDAKIYIWPTSANTNNPMTSNAISSSVPYPYHLCRTGKAGVGASQ